MKKLVSFALALVFLSALGYAGSSVLSFRRPDRVMLRNVDQIQDQMHGGSLISTRFNTVRDNLQDILDVLLDNQRILIQRVYDVTYPPYNVQDDEKDLEPIISPGEDPLDVAAELDDNDNQELDPGTGLRFPPGYNDGFRLGFDQGLQEGRESQVDEDSSQTQLSNEASDDLVSRMETLEAQMDRIENQMKNIIRTQQILRRQR